MKKLLPNADMAVLLDNSGDPAYTVVAYGKKDAITWNHRLPNWAAGLR